MKKKGTISSKDLKTWEDYTKNPDVVLVVGGTRKLLWLIKLKMSGTKIVLTLLFKVIQAVGSQSLASVLC